MNPTPLLACFFCGVDSRVLLYFFLVFVLSLVLGSLAFLVWAYGKGEFHQVERTKFDVFDDPERGCPGAITAPPLSSPPSS